MKFKFKSATSTKDVKNLSTQIVGMRVKRLYLDTLNTNTYIHGLKVSTMYEAYYLNKLIYMHIAVGMLIRISISLLNPQISLMKNCLYTCSMVVISHVLYFS